MSRTQDGAARIRFLTRLRTKLFLLVMLPVIPALGLALYTNLEQRRTEMDKLRQETIGLAKVAAAYEENFVKNARQLLSTLAQFPFLVFSTNRTVCGNHFSNLRKLSPDYLNFGLIEKDGEVFASAVRTNTNVDLSDRSYFRPAVATRRFAIGDFQVGRLTDVAALDFGYPVVDQNGSVERVLFASLDLKLLSKTLAQIQLPPGAAVTMIDRNGSVLARFPEAEKWVGQNLSGNYFVDQIFRRNEGSFQGPGIDGVARLYSVTPIYDAPAQSPGLFVSVGIPSNLAFSHANEILARNLIILAAVGFGALLMARWYAGHFVLAPISSLVAAARRIASGDLTARVSSAEKTGELHLLAETFNSMADAQARRQAEVERANAEMVSLNAQLEQRVLERTAELTALNKELEAFSYSVSHDLRAPLRHIDGFSQMLKKHAAGVLDDKGKRHLDVISEAAKKMGVLIDELLIFSRTGRKEMTRNQVRTANLVASVIADMAPELTSRSIEWKIAELPDVHGDESMLRQVWINLIANAVKYTRTRARAVIEIGGRNDGEQTFYVRDNGVGFDMAYADKLFGVFQRLHRESEFEGTGIGLANVRRVITRHGGRVWAESKIEEGATFYFSMPNRDQNA